MNVRFVVGLVAGVGIVALGANFYLRERTPESSAAPVADAMPLLSPASTGGVASAPPQAHEAMPPEPLPALADSDAAIAAAIAALYQSPALPAPFFPTQIVHRIVATIDNLPREQLPVAIRVLRPADGALLVTGTDEPYVLSPSNANRYSRYLELLRHTDAQALAALYRRFQPLLQQAYEALGYPGRSFDDRVVVVIDHLLAAPDPPAPLSLLRPNVMYRYSDTTFEHLSAGQKALIRLGPEAEAEVKAKLREVRLQLTQPGAR